jgi:hypothetical protein
VEGDDQHADRRASTGVRVPRRPGKVTGSVSNDFMPRVPIEEGEVKGSQLSFKLRLQTVTLGYSGSVAGDKLTLKTKVLEEKPSTGQTLGGVLRGVDVLTATRDK